MSGATGLLEQVYAWLPVAFFADFLVVGTLMAVARHRYRAAAPPPLGAAARRAEDAQPGDTA